jgi:AmmeMemoRadiSam system protein B
LCAIIIIGHYGVNIMRIREYSLPSGWYPRDSAEISRFLTDFTGQKVQYRAAVSPHAGWFYSGRLAARAISGMAVQAQTIVVLGGHLPAGRQPLFALEDAVRTPLGPMPIDGELRALLQKELDGEEDRWQDNTIEVLLPMARFFFPSAMLLWLRLPAESSSFEAGKAVARAAEKLNRKVNVLASTDLTHYGANYGFTPQGSGPAALKWVKEVNDRNFIRALESGDPQEVLRRAGQDQSSCSPGAVLGAMGFAQAVGLSTARLLEYATSADVSGGEEIPHSFVGYAACAFG